MRREVEVGVCCKTIWIFSIELFCLIFGSLLFTTLYFQIPDVLTFPQSQNCSLLNASLASYECVGTFDSDTPSSFYCADANIVDLYLSDDCLPTIPVCMQCHITTSLVSATGYMCFGGGANCVLSGNDVARQEPIESHCFINKHQANQHCTLGLEDSRRRGWATYSLIAFGFLLAWTCTCIGCCMCNLCQSECCQTSSYNWKKEEEVGYFQNSGCITFVPMRYQRCARYCKYGLTYTIISTGITTVQNCIKTAKRSGYRFYGR